MAEKKIPRTPVPDASPDPEVVAQKGNERTGRSTLFHHHGLDIWSVSFEMPGHPSFWSALPNERIARGAFAGGPPYEDPLGPPPAGR
jgi:hypothetical protein